MEKQIQQVLKFHTTFGANIENSPIVPSQDRVKLRCELVREETQELIKAMETGNLVETADGIIDSMYVIIGSAIEFGMSHLLVQMFDEVQRSNMSKCDKDGNAIKREDDKILKSELFSKPDLKSILFPPMKSLINFKEQLYNIQDENTKLEYFQFLKENLNIEQAYRDCLHLYSQNQSELEKTILTDFWQYLTTSDQFTIQDLNCQNFAGFTAESDDYKFVLVRLLETKDYDYSISFNIKDKDKVIELIDRNIF